jgi:hypothetical protein
MMKITFGQTFYILLTTGILAGCEKDDPQNVKVDKDLIQELDNKAIDVVTINLHNYFLDAYLWRDFMPVSPPDGKPLISINWLICADSIAIPDNIKLVQQYVISGDSVWIADYDNETHQTPVYKIESVSRNGPKWGPFVHVDVIARISDSNTNLDYYLKLDNAYILRTD